MRFFRFALMGIGIMLLTACADYSEIEAPTAHIIRASSPSPLSTGDPAKAFHNEMQEKWQKAEPRPENFLYDFETERAREFRALFHSEDLAQRLSESVSLELVLCLAYERSPELQSLRKKRQAARERYSQAGFLYDTLDAYSSFTRTLKLSTGMAMQAPKIADQAPFPRSFAIMGEVITTEIELANLEYLIGLRDLILDLSQDYVEILFLDHAIKIQEEQLNLLQGLADSTGEELKSGLTPYANVLKVEIATAQIRLDLETYIQKRSALCVRILSALDLPASTNLGIPHELTRQQFTMPLTDLYSLARQSRQEIQISKLEIKRQEQLIDLAQSELYPTVTVGLSYFENKEDERIGTGDSMPTFPEVPEKEPRFSFGQRQSYLREMVLEKEAMEKDLRQLESSSTTREIRDLYFELDVAWRSLILYRDTLVSLAQESLQSSEASFLAPGKQKMDFLDVLDAQRTLLEVRLELEQSKRDYLWKLIDLEKAVGTRLFGKEDKGEK